MTTHPFRQTGRVWTDAEVAAARSAAEPARPVGDPFGGLTPISRGDRPNWTWTDINNAAIAAGDTTYGPVYDRSQVPPQGWGLGDLWDRVGQFDDWAGSQIDQAGGWLGDTLKGVPLGQEGSRWDLTRDAAVDFMGEYGGLALNPGAWVGGRMGEALRDPASQFLDYMGEVPGALPEVEVPAGGELSGFTPTTTGDAATGAQGVMTASGWQPEHSLDFGGLTTDAFPDQWIVDRWGEGPYTDDQVHEWLTTPQAQSLLGLTPQGADTSSSERFDRALVSSAIVDDPALTGGMHGFGDEVLDDPLGAFDPADDFVPVEQLVVYMFDQMNADAEDAYQASMNFYDDRETVLNQNILDMEELKRRGIVGAAEAQRTALLELQRTRTERLKLDELKATGRLGELEGFRREQEQTISDRIRDRGAGVRSNFDTRIANAEAALAALGITTSPEVGAAGSLGGALLDSQAGSQQALTDRFRMANEQVAVDRGMDLQGTYSEARTTLADYLWDANRQNNAYEQAALQGLSEGVLGEQQTVEGTLAQSRFDTGSQLRSAVGAFDPLTGQRTGDMGGDIGIQNYKLMIAMQEQADTEAKAEAERQRIAQERAGWFQNVGGYMGLNQGVAQGFGETGLLPSLYDTLFNAPATDAGADTWNKVPVTINNETYYVDPEWFQKYQQSLTADSPLYDLPTLFQGQQLDMPVFNMGDLIEALQLQALQS